MKLAVHCEHPNRRIHSFEGTLFVQEESKVDETSDAFKSKSISLDASSLLLRGSTLRNCNWACGLVVYTGRDSKLAMNARQTPSKLSSVEVTINTLIYIIFFAQIILSTVSLVAYIIFKEAYYDDLYYLCYDYADSPIALYADNCEDDDETGDVGYFFTFFILYNNFIPISLYVTVEVVNFSQAYFIDCDLKMYYEKDDVPAVARTSNVNGDLGKVEYLFSDKTGTLTQNEMVFRRCSVAGDIYGDPITSTSSKSSPLPSISVCSERAQQEDRENPELAPNFFFILLLSICHTVVRNKDSEEWDIQAESPDEDALVRGAREMGVGFLDIPVGHMVVDVFGVEETVEILATLPFDSTRKRMSVIMRREGRIYLFTKGADTMVMALRDEMVSVSEEVLSEHLEEFAKDGLRTLLCGMKEISEGEFEDWKRAHHDAETSQEERQERLWEVYDRIEENLNVFAITAIEDKLQDGVQETLTLLREMGIKIWVLTGDKMETAINIGYSSSLLTSDMFLVKLKGTDEMELRKKVGRLVSCFSTLTEDPSFFDRLMKVYLIPF